MSREHIHIGTRHVWGGEQPFGLSRADRRQHLYAIGKTGTGKSTLLRNLIIQDIEAGNGVGLIDPHGDLAEELLDFIPPWRTDHVVYFNPADQDHPMAFNLLQSVPPERKHLVGAGVVNAFKTTWQDSWGPRMEYILAAAISALLEVENCSILGIPRLLVDDRYRQWVLKQVRDPAVRAFWTTEFAAYDKRFRSEVIAPVQNKVGQLVMAAPIRNILGQVSSRIDPRFVMDRERIFIANLSKGRLGAETSNLLGSLLVTEFQLAAMGRADIPEHDRSDFFLYVDEFHNFANEAFATILSEARKYHLCLTLSHQYLEQLPEKVRHAVLGNVGSMVSFRVGEHDGNLLEREFGSGYTRAHFTDLPNYAVRAKLLSEGVEREPFLGRTHPPEGIRYGRRDIIIGRSRQRYARPRAEVEDKIGRWMRRGR
jgi:hypothetical protein